MTENRILDEQVINLLYKVIGDGVGDVERVFFKDKQESARKSVDLQSRWVENCEKNLAETHEYHADLVGSIAKSKEALEDLQRTGDEVAANNKKDYLRRLELDFEVCVNSEASHTAKIADSKNGVARSRILVECLDLAIAAPSKLTVYSSEDERQSVEAHYEKIAHKMRVYEALADDSNDGETEIGMHLKTLVNACEAANETAFLQHENAELRDEKMQLEVEVKNESEKLAKLVEQLRRISEMLNTTEN